MKPKVSIIMGVWNGERHVGKSIDSILKQNFSNFEFIIVDDASTDNTLEILNEYAKKDVRINVIKNEKNIGLTKSLNKGICAAQGEYIARMDAGDISESSRFAKQVLFLNKNYEYGMIGSWADLIDDESKKIGILKYPTDNNSLKNAMIRHNNIVHSSVMIRRSILDAVGLYDEKWKYAQDYELFLRLSNITKIANIDECLVSYRISSRSITSRKNREQTLFAVRARIKAIQNGQYSRWCYIYVVLPWLSSLLPYSFKRFLKQ